ARDREAAAKRASAAEAREAKLAAGRIIGANARLREGFERTTEGALKLGRGIAMLGLTSEESMQKILQTMLRVQGVVDTVRGTMDLGRGAAGMIDAVGERRAARATLAGLSGGVAGGAGAAGRAGGGAAAAGGAGAAAAGGMGATV